MMKVRVQRLRESVRNHYTGFCLIEDKEKGIGRYHRNSVEPWQLQVIKGWMTQSDSCLMNDEDTTVSTFPKNLLPSAI
jgi:hypothetical protein